MRLIIFFVVLLISSCHRPGDSKKSNVQFGSLNVDSLAEIDANEKNHPQNYFVLKATYTKNLIGQWEIKGTVLCNATMTVYKDVVLKISYYNDNHFLLGSVERTVEIAFGSGTMSDFSFIEEGLPNADSIGVSFVTATIVT